MDTSRHGDTHSAHRVTFIGALINGLNGLAKIVVGSIASSQALIADGVHSLSDLVSDVFVLGAVHFGHQKPDDDHPYGHGRFETVATLFLGAVLIGVAGGLSWDSLSRLLFGSEALSAPGMMALVITMISIASKEWLYHFTMRVAKRIDSKLLEANAWHHRTDSLSSVLVLIAIVGGLLGYPWLDQVGAIIVGLMVAYIGIKLIWDSLKELVDTAIPEEQSNKLREAAMKIPGVVDINDVKTRTMGSGTILDLHIQVASQASVSEGHQIGMAVSHHLHREFPDVRYVTFHIDPQSHDDHHQEGASDLPLRPQVEEILQKKWQAYTDFPLPNHLDIHYLDKSIDIDLYYLEGHSLPGGLSSLQRKVEGLSADIPWLRNINVWEKVL